MGNGGRPDDPDAFAREMAKLQKINSALMSRVERSMDHQMNAFSLFETAIALDGQVRRRTQELQHTLRTLERANNELVRSKTQAENANSSKTSFLASVSHDLLQPLNAARLALSALHGLDMAPEGPALVSQVETALVSLEELIRTLLDISKLDAGVLRPDPRPFAVAEILEPLTREFSGIAQKRKLRLRIRPSDEIVVSDPLMLRRIVQNLIANALRYTRKGGVVVGCRGRGDMLRIEVVDTGPGIPPHRREAIFQEFHRDDVGDDGTAGFGLGLAIVRRLALALGHDVDLVSRVGHGSVFSVGVPRIAGGFIEAAEPALKRAAAPQYGVGEAFVLLVENEPSVAEAMESLLGRWGCAVVTATSGQEAERLLSGLECQPHLVIADLHLDGGELGYDAIARVQNSLGANVPAFIITADHSPKAAAEIAARGLEVLKKPVKPAELRSLMAYLLA